MILQDIIQKEKQFLNGDPIVFFSPGRVNLIGEHIDYLGGNVFPSAISLGTYAIVTKRTDKEFHFLSYNFKQFGTKRVVLDQLAYDEERYWANYPTGMIDAFIKRGLHIPFGLNIIIYGTLPNGAGLSSSASLEVLMGVVLRDMYHFDISMIDIVQVAQYVENHYVGVNCGIMDQFAVGMSKENHALYLNTTTLSYELVPLELGDYVIVIGNTNKKRALSDSKYNERRRECDQGLDVVQQYYPDVKALCDLSEEAFQKIENNFAFEHIKRRVKHAVTENDRTKKAVDALRAKNMELFGFLLNMSHKSLKNDFEVSCFELDVLVDSFIKYGAIGARMTGAGFGGCIISIVPEDNVKSLIKHVAKEYQDITEYTADFYICKTSDGTKQLTKEEWI